MDAIKDKLRNLYPQQADETFKALEKVLKEFKENYKTSSNTSNLFSEKDLVLICYADHVKEPGKKTFHTMAKFLDKFIKKSINRVHFLPFFPYSSDDGFSVIDYYAVKEDFGGWQDVQKIGKNFYLMFDLVINHLSSKSKWFQSFLTGDEKYQDFFIAFDKKVGTSSVFRPRTHPLLTIFETKKGKKYVWTTFSADQIDPDFKNPQVLIEYIKILLFYIKNGAKIIRLDAVGYLWKELGTSCIHLPQTHLVIKLLRDILEEVAPNVWIITETNVPHNDNIAYFGNGFDEAHLVYNFTLPPLLLYTFLKQDSKKLTKWAKGLKSLSGKTAYFNFTASHDGIGVTPLKGIVDKKELKSVLKSVIDKGGKVNYRTAPGQKPQPYELNIVYKSAIGSDEGFLASQAIALSFKGVPAIYFNSLIGAENWSEGVKKLGYNRAINRQKFDFKTLTGQLENAFTTYSKIYEKFIKLIDLRTKEPLFSPLADQEIIDIGNKLFAFLRINSDEKLLSLTNISNKIQKLQGSKLAKALGREKAIDLITQKEFELQGNISVKPYQFLWLK